MRKLFLIIYTVLLLIVQLTRYSGYFNVNAIFVIEYITFASVIITFFLLLYQIYKFMYYDDDDWFESILREWRSTDNIQFRSKFHVIEYEKAGTRKTFFTYLALIFIQIIILYTTN